MLSRDTNFSCLDWYKNETWYVHFGGECYQEIPSLVDKHLIAIGTHELCWNTPLTETFLFIKQTSRTWRWIMLETHPSQGRYFILVNTSRTWIYTVNYVEDTPQLQSTGFQNMNLYCELCWRHTPFLWSTPI